MQKSMVCNLTRPSRKTSEHHEVVYKLLPDLDVCEEVVSKKTHVSMLGLDLIDGCTKEIANLFSEF